LKDIINKIESNNFVGNKNQLLTLINKTATKGAECRLYAISKFYFIFT